MRAIAVITIILGLAAMVFGILFTTQSVSAKQEVADSIAPLPLAQLDGQYDLIKTQYDLMRQSGAQPGVEYNYLIAQKVGLGLARSNVGTANFVMTMGIINIIIGLGLVLTGVALLRKIQSGTA